jgi:ATP-binding cassette subfamily B protein
MKLIIRYLKPHAPAILLAFILLLVQVVCELWLPKLMSDMVDKGIQGVGAGEIQREYIYSTGWKMLGVTVTGVLATVAVAWLSARTGSLVAVRMRRDLYKQVLSFSAADIDQFSTSSLITRTTNDMLQIQYLILLGLRLLLFAPVIGLGGVVFALRSSISLSWIIAVAVLCVTGLLLIVFSLTVPKSKRLQQLIDNVNRISRENLTGMLVIRAFGNERYEESRFEDASNELRRTNRFIQRAMTFMFPVLTLIMNATMLVILWFGAGAIAASELQIGSMMAFMQYAMLIIMSFLLMSMMFTMVPRALAAAERIQEVLGTESVIRGQETGKRHANDEQMTIEFREVSFRDADTEADILQDISFTARPGEVTAIIGATGSGKSSLVHLLPRFYDVTKGQILINGIDIRDLPLEKLRGWIGYVPQRSVLYSGDIASNVRFGHPSASDAEVEEALDIAQASEFVRKLEYGIQSPISQGGTNVSGGQRQRIAIARALIKRSPIYIFDDSFSALDLKTDAALRKSLQRVTSEATVIIVHSASARSGMRRRSSYWSTDASPGSAHTRSCSGIVRLTGRSRLPN